MICRVGYPDCFRFLDDQHEAIARKVRDLRKPMTEGEGKNPTLEAREILEMLREHMGREENTMETYGYPELKLHRKYHENSLRTLEYILEFFNSASMLEHRETIANHIESRLSEEMFVDRLFARFLNERKTPAKP